MYGRVTLLVFVVYSLFIALSLAIGKNSTIPNYPKNPFIIKLEIPPVEENDSAGGIIVADLDRDGKMDYLVTRRGYVAAYRWDGKKLWVLQVDLRVGGAAESEGLPGHHGPGVQAGDIDNDKKTEVLFLTNDSTLHIVEGTTGREKWSIKIPPPSGAERWEHLAIVNLQGKVDRDIVLQATNARGYRMGRYVSAFSLDELRKGNLKPLWQRDDFLACAHNGLRVADLDGDGKDEIISGSILAPDGKELFRLDVRGHLDSVFFADVRPEIPGLEVVALEEGGNRTFLYNKNGLIWERLNKESEQEPQNAAIGDFDLTRPGLEIWCRSRYDVNQRPWVYDAKGNMIAFYELSKIAPPDWTNAGIEEIFSIYWDGSNRQLIAAKERHKSGDVAVLDPLTGKFIARFKEKADRLYVADVAGDWREELIVLSGNELHIYQNMNPNPNPNRARLWTQQWYRRSKAIWNYYSP
ncbi:VCBS repeat-containing protein [bacterium]|nr:VCBS repeat-containing protein [bacterium]